MNSMTIGISGGSGFVGHHLAKLLIANGHQVIIFSRTAKDTRNGIRFAQWNPDAKEIDRQALAALDAIVSLAGAGIADKRWTDARKHEIRSSRVDATYFLHEAIRSSAAKCRAFIAASATGYYGPDRPGLTPFTENTPPFDEFLAQVCKDWETASLSAVDRYRSVVLRCGIVLGREGGAYPELTKPMSFGIMPILGSGRQMVSWIHVEDLARLYMEALFNERYTGAYNAVSPQPVTHGELMKTIARAKGGLKIPVPVPPFVLQLIMGEASVEVLKSCTASSAKVEAAGFAFQYPSVADAMRDIVSGGD